ncbi:hypothetical protein IG631_05413 [Alternaria alternata]|nr:hypothetical protein IG631_05413 [Alternaria alternata]
MSLQKEDPRCPQVMSRCATELTDGVHDAQTRTASSTALTFPLPSLSDLTLGSVACNV